jgi:hypothetical protein
MSTKKNTTVYKKNKKTSKYGGKKSRRTTRKIRKIRKIRTTTRTKKGGAILNPADETGTKMTAGELLLNNYQQYIGHTLRCSQAQEAGVIQKIDYTTESVIIFFEEGAYQNTTKVEIPKHWIIYIE